ncbi:MAG: hypothetical protein ABIJ03_04340 [Patescibacteria group bacterium]|nr:hypothetical protein [Patescibacteria group bacterium]
MKKRRTKQQKRTSQKKQARQIKTLPQVESSQKLQVNLIPTLERLSLKKGFSSINTQFIKKDLLKSLSITVIILILLFGIKLFLG